MIHADEETTECGVTLRLAMLVCVAPLDHGGYHMSADGTGWSKYSEHSSDYVGDDVKWAYDPILDGYYELARGYFWLCRSSVRCVRS